MLLQGAVAELESYIRLEVKENLDELVQHSIRVQSIQNSFVDVRSSSQEVKSRFSRIHNRVAKCCAELRTLCARSSRIQIAMDLASSTNHALILLKRVRRLESSLDEGMLHRICDSAVIEQPKLALLIQELQILLKDTQILKIQAVQNQISTSKIASRLLQKFSTEASSSSSS